ncbi:MAG: IS3 family transposase, partial [Burkholderiales bacterium]
MPTTTGIAHGFYAVGCAAPSKRPIDNEQLDAKIFALHHSSNKSYGRPRIVDALGRANVRVGHEQVRRSLVRQHLKTVHKRPYKVTTDSEHTQPIAPNLLQRRFNGWQLNQAWVSDFTFI